MNNETKRQTTLNDIGKIVYMFFKCSKIVLLQKQTLNHQSSMLSNMFLIERVDRISNTHFYVDFIRSATRKKSFDAHLHYIACNPIVDEFKFEAIKNTYIERVYPFLPKCFSYHIYAKTFKRI